MAAACIDIDPNDEVEEEEFCEENGYMIMTEEDFRVWCDFIEAVDIDGEEA